MRTVMQWVAWVQLFNYVIAVGIFNESLESAISVVLQTTFLGMIALVLTHEQSGPDALNKGAFLRNVEKNRTRNG